MPKGVYIRKPITQERLEQMKRCSPFQNGHTGFGGGVKQGYRFAEETKIKKSRTQKEKYRLNPNSFIGIGAYWKGKKRKPFTQEHKDKLAEIRSHFIMPSGENHSNWKGGISKDKKQWFKDWRHRIGISKKYHSGMGVSYTKEYKKCQRHKRRLLEVNGGELSVKIIQMVYEDNIKKYGTLTCYLCLTPIEFRKDHLEHKTPLSRGGTNEYSNLAIACQHCNNKKHTKTETEYRKGIL